MNVEMGLGDMMEQQKQDRLGNLFALVVVADYLENAYTAGSVPDEQYVFPRGETGSWPFPSPR